MPIWVTIDGTASSGNDANGTIKVLVPNGARTVTIVYEKISGLNDVYSRDIGV